VEVIVRIAIFFVVADIYIKIRAVISCGVVFSPEIKLFDIFSYTVITGA
jgi:hypothetical protein